MSKDNGLSVMISAIVSRQLGFGVEWTDDLQWTVNGHPRGKKYCNSKAAIKLHGTDVKKDLTSLPFVVEFEYGASNEGYWRYEHMVCQMEDCRDVLAVLMVKWGR